MDEWSYVDELLRRIGDEGVFASESGYEERMKRCFRDLN